jgi:enoyl-CoA hydratase
MNRAPAQPVVLASTDGPVATITINRPKQLNALNPEVYARLHAAFTSLPSDGSVRVVLLRGSGTRAFVAGADISDYVDADEQRFRAFIDQGHALMADMAAMPIPIVAVIHGYALGGGMELALACDLVVAARSAKLGLPEATLGLLPGGGGTVRLPRLVGRLAANDLLLRARMVHAEDALRMGLVSSVVDDDAIEAELRRITADILRLSPAAVGLGKQLLREQADLPLTAALTREAAATSPLIETADGREGVLAFIEKRRAAFDQSP